MHVYICTFVCLQVCIACFVFFLLVVFFFGVEAMINQTRQQTKYCLGLATQGTKKGNGSNGSEEEEVMEKTRKDIEANQDNALNLCTEKVLLARQAYDLVSFLLINGFLFDIHTLYPSAIGGIVGDNCCTSII